MRNRGLRLIKPANFDRQPIRNYPGGYICLIRDVEYGDRYKLMRLRNPKDLASQLRDSFSLPAELSAAWQAKDAEQGERWLRAQLSSGAANDEWFDVDALRIRQHVGRVQPARIRNPAVPPPTPQRATRRSRLDRSVAAAPPTQTSEVRRRATIAIALLLVVSLLAPSFDGLVNNGGFVDFASARKATPAIPRVLMKPSLFAPRFHINGSLMIRWTAVHGAKVYEYGWSVNGGKYTQTQETPALGKSIADLSPGDVVQFRVRARHGSRRSHYASVTARKPAPEPPEPKPETQSSASSEAPVRAARPAASSRERMPAYGNMIVKTSDLRSAHIRGCPSTDCAVVGRLMNGEIVKALEQVEGEVIAGNSVWTRIDFEGRSRAFVHAPLLKPLG